MIPAVFYLSASTRSHWTSLVAQRLKHLPAVRETRVRSLGREDPPEEEMAAHSSILAWKIPWTEGSTFSRRLGINGHFTPYVASSR